MDPLSDIEPSSSKSDSSDGYETGGTEYSTQSLTSSIYEYRHEHGRRYHASKGQYLMPNDETEQERLDILHHIYLLVMDGKLHRAPIGTNPQRVLDVGTGTGIWAIDMGDNYPSAEIIGTDLSPIQPSWVPPNVRFEIDDAEQDWTFKRNSFDLVHIRHLNGAIEDWQKLLAQAYQHVKPGGWIEMAEFEMGIYSDDGSLPEDLELKRFYDLLYEATEKSGRSYRYTSAFEPLLQEAGFKDIHHQVVKLPLGPWPASKKEKEIGAFVLLSAQTGFEAFGIQVFTSVLGIPVEEAQNVIQMATKQSKNRKFHTYSRHHFYYAQKPMEE